MAQIVIGTEDGLHLLGAQTLLAGRRVDALAPAEGGTWWAIVDGDQLWRGRDLRSWEQTASLDALRATCLLATEKGLLVGSSEAHLFRLEGAAPQPVKGFEEAEGRDEWYTPWGGPPDTRSLSLGVEGSIYANVHVGGILRSRDGGATWEPTLDIDADVHQVLTHPTVRNSVLAAAAWGLGISQDGGDSWDFLTEGLHSTYARAVAVGDQHLFVTTSTGPSTRRAAIYRLDGEELEKCEDGLAEWFPQNINTGCLAARGPVVAFAVGREAYLSEDEGETWQQVAADLPEVRCLALAEGA